MFYFYTNELGFKPEFMGQLKLANSAASILGILIFNRYLKHVPFKKLLTWSTVICFVLGLTQILLVTRYNTQIGIPDKVFCIGDSLVIQTFAEINWMPILVLACRLCPKNIEGTMYAMLMALFNIGGTISKQLGALFVWMLGITDKNFDNLWIMILITCFSLILPLPLIRYIDFSTSNVDGNGDQQENEDNQKNESKERELPSPKKRDSLSALSQIRNRTESEI